MQFTPMRVVMEEGQVRVARDRLEHAYEGSALQYVPEHLEKQDTKVVWVQHKEGATIPAITVKDFIRWLNHPD